MPEQPREDSRASIHKSSRCPLDAGHGAKPGPTSNQTSAESTDDAPGQRGAWVEGDVFRGVEHRSTVLETPTATFQLGDLGLDYLDRHVKARIEVMKGVLTTQQQGDPVVVFEIVDIGPAQIDHPGSEL